MEKAELNIKGNTLDNRSSINVNIGVGKQENELSCEDKYITLDIPKVPKIIGRERELEEVKNTISENSILHIYGVAGIGKSTFVKKFIEFSKENNIFDCYGYISFASFGDEEKNREGYSVNLLKRRFLSNFNVKDTRDLENAFNNLLYKLRKFEKGKKKLLVLDDLVNLQEIEEEFLEKIFGLAENDFYIILTSRESERLENTVEYELRELSIENLKELFFKSCQKTCEKSKNDRKTHKLLENIFNELDFNTLLVEVLGKYFWSFRFKTDIREHLENILEDLKEFTIDEALENKNAIEKAYKLFDLLKLTEKEELVAKKLTVLPPEDTKFEEIFNYYFKKEFNTKSGKKIRYDLSIVSEQKKRRNKYKLKLKDLLNKMANKGILSIIEEKSDEDTVLKLHKIVRDYILSKKTPKYEDIKFQLEAFSFHLPRTDIKVYENEKKIQNYLGKILILDRTLKNLEDFEYIKDERVVEFYIKGAGVLNHLKLFDYAERFLETAKEILIRNKIIDKDLNLRDKNYIKLVASYLNILGTFYRERAKKREDFTKSVELLEKAIELAKKLDNKIFLKSLYGNISKSLKQIGDIEKSIKYGKEALEISKELNDKKGIARNYGNLATIYKSKGDYEEALKHQTEVINILKNSPETKETDFVKSSLLFALSL